MKAAKLRDQSDDEVRQLYEDTSRELLELRIKQTSGGSVNQPLKLRTLRRDVARIKTVMRERGL